MDLIATLIAIFTFSSLLTYIITPIMIRKMVRRGITGKDMNKYEKPEVAEMGGISVMLGFSFGIISAIFIITYLGLENVNLTILFAGFLTIFMTGFIGVVDDLIGWKKGIRQWQHALFPIFAALPLMAVRAGTDYVVLPFFGPINLGIAYSLLVVPIAITGASNAFNMLAGLNGLETGLGIIIISTLTLIAAMTGQTEALIIGIAILGALLIFLHFNWFPAKVFGGDSLTLMIGATAATISIIGNMEKIGVMIIALYWIELILKAKSKFQAESFGIPNKHNILSPPKNINSITHLVMTIKPMTEKQVVITILSIQVIISTIVFTMFYFKLL
ncbi:MAG: glycosyl transferase family 4 [Candidatus Diapherotrites archaeon]